MRNLLFILLALLSVLTFAQEKKAKVAKNPNTYIFTEYKTVKDYAVIYFNIVNLPQNKWQDLQTELKKSNDIFFTRIYISIDNQVHCQIKTKNTAIRPEDIRPVLQKFNADFAFTSVKIK